MKILLYTFSFLLLFAATIEAQNKIIIAIRVDDVLSRNTTILPRSIAPFEQAVEQRGGKVTWLVIPHRLVENANSDGVLVRELRSTVTRGHEVAQHGYNHICGICGQSGHEMWCTTRPLTAVEQAALINDGKKLLQDSIGVTPTLFVSPGHNEDSTTYAALSGGGFPWISTTKSGRGKIGKTLFNLPSDAEYAWSMTEANYRSQLTAALNAIRTSGEQQGCYTVLFHDYFIRSGYSNGIVIRWVGELLDSVNAIYGSRVDYRTVSSAAHYFAAATNFAQRIRPSVPALTAFNYPNPFNPSTTIRYGLPQASMVTVTIFNSIGQQVAQWVMGEQRAGWHETVWRAHSASGLYLFRIDAVSSTDPNRTFSLQKKMILLK